ncbi:MAG: alpha/beta fold hydrolase [Maricaulaceae bacterium]|jgi:alpha-beta hydrolase superfamily lysophospholipase
MERQRQLSLAPLDAPRFEDDAFVSFDGARLGLTTWLPEAEAESSQEPWAVIVAVHGMSEYSDAWWLAGPWWAEQGIAVYAYDQRGFGRSPNRGVWAGETLMAADVRAAVTAARRAHPGATVAVVGQSMGAATVLYAASVGDAPLADRVVVSAPGVRGWSVLPIGYKLPLWFAAHLTPRVSARPPRGIGVVATDNNEALYRNGRDPLFLRDTRFDTLYGLVSLMDAAYKARPADTSNMMVLYGANDQLIPQRAVEEVVENLGPCTRSAYYENGWHMLFRDLQAETVWRDVAAFLRDGDGALPSNAPPIVGATAGVGCPGSSALDVVSAE